MSIDQNVERAKVIDVARRDPRNIASVVAYARKAFDVGDRNEAIDALGMASEIAPGDFTVARVLSGYLAAEKRLDDALFHARRAVSLRPSADEARINLSGILVNLHHYEDALTELRAHRALAGPNAIVCHLSAGALRNLGRTERAIEAEREACELAPGNLEYPLNLASMLNGRARHGDALVVLDEAKSRFPDDARVYRAASGCHDATGNYAAALADAEEAVRLAPENEDFKAHLANIRRHTGLLSKTEDSSWESNKPSWSANFPKRTTQNRKSISIGEQVRNRQRIIYALILRDIRTKYSRSALGYFWAIFEPISHLLTLGVMFAYVNEAPPPVGHSLFEFYCTGLMPYLMFAHIQNEVMASRGSAGALLMLPRVRTTDIMFSKVGLHLATEVFVGIIVFSAFGLAGFQSLPSNILICLGAIGLMALLGLGVGAINMVIQNFLHSWETLFQMIIRLLYFASGIYYSPISMPDFVRNILQWNPVLQCVELFRFGFYPEYHPFWLHVQYTVAFVLISLLLGFSLEKVMRRHMVKHT